jgi:hypothetical protein
MKSMDNDDHGLDATVSGYNSPDGLLCADLARLHVKQDRTKFPTIDFMFGHQNSGDINS